MRVKNKKRQYRILFVFDPERKAILLVGGDKRGDKRFYQRLVPIADKLYENYLEKKEKKNGEKK